MTMIDPYLVREWSVPDCRHLLDFYVEGFGGVEVSRECLPDGRVVAAEVVTGRYLLRLRQCPVPVSGADQEPGASASWHRPALSLPLDDATTAIPRIIRAGGRVELADRHRSAPGAQYVVHDPCGQRWVVPAQRSGTGC